MLLSGWSSFVLGFFATGGGTFVPFVAGSASPSSFVGAETSWFFCAAALASAAGLVSTTTLLLLFAKMKLAVLVGDLWRSGGEAGELRREVGPPRDLAAVRRRMASCSFIEGDTEVAGGDLIVRDGTDAGGSTRGSDLGAGGWGVTVAGGGVGGGELRMRDFLMGFCGASELKEEAGTLFLILTSEPGSSCACTGWSSAVCWRDGAPEGGDSARMAAGRATCGLWSSAFAGPDSCFRLERSCTDEGGGEAGGASGLGWLEFSDGAEAGNSWPAAPSVSAPSGWWRSSVGGAGGIL